MWSALLQLWINLLLECSGKVARGFCYGSGSITSSPAADSCQRLPLVDPALNKYLLIHVSELKACWCDGTHIWQTKGLLEEGSSCTVNKDGNVKPSDYSASSFSCAPSMLAHFLIVHALQTSYHSCSCHPVSLQFVYILLNAWCPKLDTVFWVSPH